MNSCSFEPPAARIAEAGPLVDLLDRIGEHLRDHADRVDADREDAGQRAEREHQHEGHREHDVRERAGEHADEARRGPPSVAGVVLAAAR